MPEIWHNALQMRRRAHARPGGTRGRAGRPARSHADKDTTCCIDHGWLVVVSSRNHTYFLPSRRILPLHQRGWLWSAATLAVHESHINRKMAKVPGKDALLAELKSQGIKVRGIVEHDAVVTTEEMMEKAKSLSGGKAKNLFLKDKSKPKPRLLLVSHLHDTKAAHHPNLTKFLESAKGPRSAAASARYPRLRSCNVAAFLLEMTCCMRNLSP